MCFRVNMDAPKETFAYTEYVRKDAIIRVLEKIRECGQSEETLSVLDYLERYVNTLNSQSN